MNHFREMESINVFGLGLVFPALPENEEILEWTYVMRREMQEILPGIYLGPYSCAMKTKRSSLESAGITHIICVRQDVEAHIIRPNFPNDFNYLVLDIADSPNANIIKFIPIVKGFIDSCLRSRGIVLVHGNAGISRSAALVIAYIMETYGQSYSEAYLLVQQKRFCINPNGGFVGQLMEYEPIYKAKLLLKSGEGSQNRGTLKRGIEELEEDMTGMSVYQKT